MTPQQQLPTTREPLQHRFTDDPELGRQLGAVFLEDCPGRVEAIAAAFARNDLEALARAVHTLKGGVSVLCENGPTPVAQALEAVARSGDLPRARVMFEQLQKELDRLVTELRAMAEPVEAA